MRLIDKRHESADAVSFVFQPETELNWQAGQFLAYSLPSSAGASMERPYFPIGSAPHEGQVLLLARFADAASGGHKTLEEMPFDEVVEVSSPEGDFTVQDPTETMVWIAEGAGIAPFRSILRDLDHRGLPIGMTILYLNNSEDFIFRDEIEELGRRHKNLAVRYLSSEDGLDEALIQSSAPDLQKALVYISGPERTVASLERVVQELGVPSHRIKTAALPTYDAR